MRMIELQAIIRRRDNATSGRWYLVRAIDEKNRALATDTNTEPMALLFGKYHNAEANADFFVHARDDIAALIAEVIRCHLMVQTVGEAALHDEKLFRRYNTALEKSGGWSIGWANAKTIKRLTKGEEGGSLTDAEEPV